MATRAGLGGTPGTGLGGNVGKGGNNGGGIGGYMALAAAVNACVGSERLEERAPTSVLIEPATGSPVADTTCVDVIWMESFIGTNNRTVAPVTFEIRDANNASGGSFEIDLASNT